MLKPDAGGVPYWAWAVLGAALVMMLAVDFWSNRTGRADSKRGTLLWSVIWVLCGLLFGIFVWVVLGGRLAQEYYAAYAMEKGLSLDNLFLFYVLFRSLGVPHRFQHKVLFWGILGAVVFRGVFIFLGTAALERWGWVSYVFAAVLLYAAWYAFRHSPQEQQGSRLVDWISKRLPVSKEVGRGEFLVRRDGGWVATPLFLALLTIEVTDIMFAIDSVPAALSVTRIPFVVYSSNVFAIVGLRALYLFLSSTIVRLRYLHYGLAAVLAFAAFKMVTDEWFKIPPWASILVVVLLIGGAIVASVQRGGGAGDGSHLRAPTRGV